MKSIRKSKYNALHDHEPNDIHTLRIRLFLKYTNSKPCEFCEIFKQTKVYRELSENFRRYVPDIETFLYEELECETDGLKLPRFSDKDVKESNDKNLTFSMDYQTNNYVERRFYLYEGQSLSNSTGQSHTLYSLINSDATSFIFKAEDKLNPVPNKLFSLLRWYPELNEYKVV